MGSRHDISRELAYNSSLGQEFLCFKLTELQAAIMLIFWPSLLQKVSSLALFLTVEESNLSSTKKVTIG